MRANTEANGTSTSFTTPFRTERSSPRYHCTLQRGHRCNVDHPTHVHKVRTKECLLSKTQGRNIDLFVNTVLFKPFCIVASVLQGPAVRPRQFYSLTLLRSSAARHRIAGTKAKAGARRIEVWTHPFEPPDSRKRTKLVHISRRFVQYVHFRGPHVSGLNYSSRAVVVQTILFPWASALSNSP